MKKSEIQNAIEINPEMVFTDSKFGSSHFTIEGFQDSARNGMITKRVVARRMWLDLEDHTTVKHSENTYTLTLNQVGCARYENDVEFRDGVVAAIEKRDAAIKLQGEINLRKHQLAERINASLKDIDIDARVTSVDGRYTSVPMQISMSVTQAEQFAEFLASAAEHMESK
jgi:hypothetical protein